MYSRYTPNASGGFDRREFPDSADLHAAQSRSPPDEPPAQPQPEPMGPALLRPEPQRPMPGPSGSPPARPNPPHRPGPSPRPPHRPGPPFAQTGPGPRPMPPRPPHRPGPPNAQPGTAPSPFGGLFGPEGMLGRLLPRGLETEDLLILAVLLLAMKQDGATGTELLIAVGLYLWL